MQDVTPWPDSFDVSEPVARVLVDGQEVDVESVTVTSELDSAMPERVAAGGGGVVAATGSASILRSDDVAEAGFNPWGDAQSFVNASEVVVEAGYRDPVSGGVGCVRQITGQVESLDGGATSNSVGLEFVDYTPLLDQDIIIDPLLKEYPPFEIGSPRRGAGLSPIYVTDRILRHCGFYATPRMVSGAVISAPMMGSTMPERGALYSSFEFTDYDLSAAFSPSSWGVALADGRVSIFPDFHTRGHGRLTSNLHVSFLRSDLPVGEPADSQINVLWRNPDLGVQVQCMANGGIAVRYLHSAEHQPLVAVMDAVDVGASEAFAVIVEPSGRVTIYASNGAEESGAASLPGAVFTSDIDRIYFRVPPQSRPVGGAQVAFSSVTNHQYVRTAHIDPPANNHSLRAFPSKVNVNCLSLLKDQAAAELAAMWVDERGHFRWRNRNKLRNSTPVGTLTAVDDLFDLPWQVPVRSVFSRIELEHDVPTVTRRGVPTITVSDSRGSTLSDDDTENRFIEPPANQDWHQVDSPQWLGGSDFSYWALKRGRGSWRGGVIVDDDNEERLSYSSRLDQSWQQISTQKWLLISRANNLLVDEYIEQRFRDRVDLYGKFAGENLPIIRCWGLTEWDPEKTVGASRGPSLAPVFVHNIGPWIQDAAELRTLANWLAAHLTHPDVVLRRIPVVPDPRIQLGDVFWLEDQTAYHVRLRVVVMGKTLRYQATNSGYEMAQEITCRVLQVERFGVRYDELETAWKGRDYSDFEAAWSGQDYANLEDDPLEWS